MLRSICMSTPASTPTKRYVLSALQCCDAVECREMRACRVSNTSRVVSQRLQLHLSALERQRVLSYVQAAAQHQVYSTVLFKPLNHKQNASGCASPCCPTSPFTAEELVFEPTSRPFPSL